MSAAETAKTFKARLRNIGNGYLEFSDDKLKFYVETGRFRKHREIAREIPIAEIESVEKQENDLCVRWKDTTNLFALEAEQIKQVYERIAPALKDHMNYEEKTGTATKSRNELAEATIATFETVDSIFNLLKSLHGRVEWKLVESNFAGTLEKATGLSNLSPNSISLDVAPLASAVQLYRPREIANEAFDVLRRLYEYFDKLQSSADDEKYVHPNRQEAKKAIQAIYLLNDLALGALVGDNELEKEKAELAKVVDDLAQVLGPIIDLNVLKASVAGLLEETENRASIFDEARSILELQLKELLTTQRLTSGASQTNTAE